MGVLEQVKQMRENKDTDEKIIERLQTQGVSPKAISDAMDQEKIKNAISNQENSEATFPSIMKTKPSPPKPQAYTPKTKELSQDQGEQLYVQEPQKSYQPPEIPMPQKAPEMQAQGYIPSQESYQPPIQENYLPPPTQEAYQPQTPEAYPSYETNASMDSDTTMDIAEQIFLEKIKKTQKQIQELNEFKALTETQLENISQRLKRIEAIVDKMQISIIDKVGSYGKDIHYINKEMEMMQNSFRKIADPLTKKAVKHRTTNHKKTSKKK